MYQEQEKLILKVHGNHASSQYTKGRKVYLNRQLDGVDISMVLIKKKEYTIIHDVLYNY